MANGDAHHFPVVIVGGGPVGMVLAMSLARLGVRSAVVNTETDSNWRPKGSTHNARTMEHYRRLGLTPAIRRVGMPADHPTDVGYFTALTGWELARLPMPSETEKMRRVAEASVTDQVPEPLFRSNQMYVERHLHTALKTFPSVAMRFGWLCTGYTDHGDRVTVEIENAASGARQTLTCDYLVGCDGGHSVVRRQLGIKYGGEVLAPQPYAAGATISTHLRAPALYERGILERSCWQHWIVNGSTRTLLTTLDGEGEFLFNTRCRSVDDPPDPAFITRVFHATVGAEVPFAFIGHWPWVSGYALVADCFGAGRVLLAGDAVHLFTPTGGFGMNTGIDDAVNLAWKLAAMVQGWGGPELLPSYEVERRPIAFRNTGHSKRLAKNVGDVPAAAQMSENTSDGAAARRAAGNFLSTFGEEFASLGVQLGARYDGSPVIVSDGAAAPPDDPAVYVPSGVPGGRAPHVWHPDRSSLYDHFGPAFTLLLLPGCRDDGAAFAAAAKERKVPLTIHRVPVSEARALYGAEMALIRPDLHVAWRGAQMPADPDRLLARVTGWNTLGRLASERS
jgi:2-polyprenyl-6-methoxyphenol hydroxylase-like FAD-dependent oxidoreductase